MGDTMVAMDANDCITVRWLDDFAKVASIDFCWGFGNLGRFAAAYAARYGENPAVTLRQSA
jgi:hypothetical protein